eukprot:TRINITY_DN290_c0_g1_i4.p1 TRINITY_DN290_c0_g1~~TRINITY_DN290_c0_g1_i4.p1  ORF type:complete len:402 (-),score=89.65 TRINITY_DN290_c0_g1_i4:101-1219(-)
MLHQEPVMSAQPVSQTHFFLSSPAQPIHMEHKRTKLFGKKMSVLTMNDKKWLIGVQMAQLLQRETYNLYRSMKVKYIAVQRATPDQVDFLVKTNVVKPGTRSITFVPFEPAIAYISEEIKKVGTRKKKKVTGNGNGNGNSNGNNNNNSILNNLGQNNSSANIGGNSGILSGLNVASSEDLANAVLPQTPNGKHTLSIGSPQSAFEMLCATAEVEYTSSPKQLLAAAVAKGMSPLLQQYQQQLQLQNTASFTLPQHYGAAFQLPPPQPSSSSVANLRGGGSPNDSSTTTLSAHFGIGNLLNDTKLPGLGNLPFFPTLPQLQPNYSNFLQTLANTTANSGSSTSNNLSSKNNLSEFYDILNSTAAPTRLLGHVG